MRLVDALRPRHTEDGGGGRKDQRATGDPPNLLEQVERGRHIVLVVQRRVGNGLRNDRLGGEVQHAFRLHVGKHAAQEGGVADIPFIQLPPAHGFLVPGRQVVDHGDVVAMFGKELAHVRADVAGTATDQQACRLRRHP